MARRAGPVRQQVGAAAGWAPAGGAGGREGGRAPRPPRGGGNSAPYPGRAARSRRWASAEAAAARSGNRPRREKTALFTSGCVRAKRSPVSCPEKPWLVRRAGRVLLLVL